MEIARISGKQTQTSAKTAAPAIEAQKTTKSAQRRQDKLELTKQAVSLINQAQAEAAAPKQKKEKSWMDEMLESSQQQAEAAGEGFKAEARCLKIASNLMSGKKVPVKDQQYLMEKNPKLYQMAIAMRRVEKDPEECESVLGDEEEKKSESAATEGTTETAAAPVAAAAPSSSEETAAPSE